MEDRTDTTENRTTEVEEVPKSPWSWLAPALTFLAGLLLGVVVVVAGNLGEDSDGDAAQATPTPSATLPAEDPNTGLVARVPQSCLDIADEATAARERVEEAAVAARDLDARRLSEALDSLQALQRQVQALAEECRSQASVSVPPTS